jgi:hypothetical protein
MAILQLHLKREDLGKPSCKKCFPAPSQELSIFSQAYSFFIENYGLGRMLRVFWRAREPFLQERFPDLTALNACWYYSPPLRPFETNA